MQKQIDAEGVKLGQESHKIFQAAAQAVDVPGHHDVELAHGGVPTQSIERRPSIAALSAADAVILPRHAPAAGAFFWCRAATTLRQGARVIEDSRRLRENFLRL